MGCRRHARRVGAALLGWRLVRDLGRGLAWGIGAATLAGASPAAALSARVDALPGEPAAPRAAPAPRPAAKPVPPPRRPIPPWFFGRDAEPRLVPPRSIPGRAGRPAERTPTPRTKPAETGPGGDTTASTRPKPKMPPRAPGAVDVPVAPLD
ncbi:hypothetical protein J2S22_001724 [Rhodoplanes tepidamans]|uniref:Translation initiation factor IF-2 n=1 Tax=Rhodoplanes tepidamans TaxID=200616 RepID=A0ABT5J7K7_RHOTP|nr:hypothetical protein [Rhodoplanes tepidamans]MDC7785634.1 hypothetical protein [Rhodoplanes tepidamans]MDQ0354800.1 hypothetical protein [Rhodoplanes tepidamans]